MTDRRPDPHTYRLELLLGWKALTFDDAGHVTSWAPGRRPARSVGPTLDEVADWLRVRQHRLPFHDLGRISDDLAFQLWLPNTGPTTPGWHGNLRRVLTDAVEEVRNYDGA